MKVSVSLPWAASVAKKRNKMQYWVWRRKWNAEYEELSLYHSPVPLHCWRQLGGCLVGDPPQRAPINPAQLKCAPPARTSQLPVLGTERAGSSDPSPFPVAGTRASSYTKRRSGDCCYQMPYYVIYRWGSMPSVCLVRDNWAKIKNKKFQNLIILNRFPGKMTKKCLSSLEIGYVLI